jgi:hypothetical protein
MNTHAKGANVIDITKGTLTQEEIQLSSLGFGP